MFKPLPKLEDPITIIAGVAMAGSAASAVGQRNASKKAATAQREANTAQQRSASASAQRERIKAIREARIRAGQIESAGGVMGMGQQSSGIAGSIASIGSQAADNIGNINVQEGFAAMASDANNRAAKAMSTAANWQAIGSISSSIFNQSAGAAFAKAGAKAGNVGTNSITDAKGGYLQW